MHARIKQLKVISLAVTLLSVSATLLRADGEDPMGSRPRITFGSSYRKG